MDAQVDFQNRIFSIPEAAEWLRISRSFLYSLIAEKKLRAVKLGKRSVITGKEIARFITAAEGKAV